MTMALPSAYGNARVVVVSQAFCGVQLLDYARAAYALRTSLKWRV